MKSEKWKVEIKKVITKKNEMWKVKWKMKSELEIWKLMKKNRNKKWKYFDVIEKNSGNFY